MSRSLTTVRRAAIPVLSAVTLTAALLAAAVPAAAADVGSHPHELTTLGSRIIFVANDGSTGIELWQTDGTTTGQVADINAAGDANPSDLVKAGSSIFFSATDGTSGGVWRTTGTTASTMKLSSVGPFSGPVTAVGNRIYYAGSEPGTGVELYTSDGTVAGTKRITDLRPGVDSSVASTTLAPLGTRVVFGAYGADDGMDLWSSGPTAGSAKRIKNFGVDASIEWIRNAGSLVYFQLTPSPGTDELWKSDGTKNGTVRIRTLPNAADDPHVAGSTLFFRLDTPSTGFELWRSKGTAATTGMVKEIYPGETGSDPEAVAVVGSRIYFAAYTPVTPSKDDYEVWRSDGTRKGTVRLKNINPDDYSEPTLLQDVNGTLMFFATDGVHGLEPWRSDGTRSGTVMIADVNPDAGSSSPSLLPRAFAKLGKRVYFAANDGTHGVELWRTTSGGASLWADILPN